MAAVEGITGTVALAGTSAEMSLASELVIAFSPAVNEVTLDAIDIDNPTGLKAVFAAADGSVLLDAQPPPPAMGTKRVRVTHSSRTPIDHLTLSYTRQSATDEWYVDELAFDVWGCGDGEVESGAGETCDDGNTVQCDGCDNGCVASTSGCLAGNACVANGTTDGCAICNATARTDAGVEIVPSRDPQAGVGCPP
jgi:cysteine-rich repeat protein